MILKKTESGFTLAGSLEDLERLQSTAYYAKEYLYNEMQGTPMSWAEKRTELNNIYSETLQLESTLE